jgi:hypothetical protein
MKPSVLLNLTIAAIIVGSLAGTAKASGVSVPLTPLAEMSAGEIARLDATTLFANYSNELKSDKLTQEQKDAVRLVMMRNMAAYEKESKNNQVLLRSLLLGGAGLLGWFIRRWFRDRFT